MYCSRVYGLEWRIWTRVEYMDWIVVEYIDCIVDYKDCSRVYGLEWSIWIVNGVEWSKLYGLQQS